MIYIHDSTCISPQQTFNGVFLEQIPEQLNAAKENVLLAVEPAYEQIPPGILRRMGRAVRLGVGAAMPILARTGREMDGIIIGTSMGGMEDCVKFLNQVIEYNEGTLTPTNFVQSTPNAIAGQLGLMKKNTGYNITHVHRGFSFENALIDAQMRLEEFPSHRYLLGAVDEISSYNYNIEKLDGAYKSEPCEAENLYDSTTQGSIAGEGSAMFIVNNESAGAIAKLKDIYIFHSEDSALVQDQGRKFLQRNFTREPGPDLLLSGENGDVRFRHFYTTFEERSNAQAVGRFKHLCGEHPTASAFGFWMATEILRLGNLPVELLKRGSASNIKTVLIYNNYKGIQHTFMLLEKASD